MKTIFITIACISLFSFNLLGQKEKETSKLKEGVLYHVSVENQLIPTTNIKATLEKYEGRVKLIIHSKKAKEKTYKIPEKIAIQIDKGEPISIKSMNRSCKCAIKDGGYYQIAYYVSCAPYHSCESCCNNSLPTELAYDWINQLYD